LLLSFSRTLVVGTWLALRSVELHLLQSVVVISPGRNVPLDLRVRLTLEVTTLLFQLHFEDASVNLDREVCHALQSRRALVMHGDLRPDLVLQSSIELRGQRIVVPTDLGCEDRELCAVRSSRRPLSQHPEVAVGFQRVVSDIERFLDRCEETGVVRQEFDRSGVRPFTYRVIDEIFHVWLNPFKGFSSEVRQCKQQLSALVAVELLRVHLLIQLAL
jgi:hypothetical protein